MMMRAGDWTVIMRTVHDIEKIRRQKQPCFDLPFGRRLDEWSEFG
jgi:hypothetical protein